MDTKTRELVEQGIGQAFDAWSKLHPNLAGVLDRIEVTDRVVDRLRDTQAYEDAVKSYVQARIEVDFISNIVKLASEVLPLILAL